MEPASFDCNCWHLKWQFCYCLLLSGNRLLHNGNITHLIPVTNKYIWVKNSSHEAQESAVNNIHVANLNRLIGLLLWRFSACNDAEWRGRCKTCCLSLNASSVYWWCPQERSSLELREIIFIMKIASGRFHIEPTSSTIAVCVCVYVHSRD